MFKARILQIIRFVRVFEKIFGNFRRIFGKFRETFGRSRKLARNGEENSDQWRWTGENIVFKA